MFSCEEYKIALSNVGEKLNTKQLEMLRFHYFAPNRAVTSKQLAKEVGYSNHNIVNIHYSKIGRLLSNAIGKLPKQRKDGTYRWWTILSSFTRNNGHFIWIMHPALAQALEELNLVMEETVIFPDEVSENQIFREGAVRQIRVNAYERNVEARSLCISHYGTSCFVCDFDFCKVYGEVLKGFIHVHHLRPLSEIGIQYEINAIDDLRPVCPNCHAVIHSRKNNPYSIEEVKMMMLLVNTKA